jgi:DNA-binding MltR family transcriptional regulator
MNKTANDPLADWNSFFKEIQDESPRAAVIIASAFLDAQLRVIIGKSLVDDPKIVDELLGSEDKPDRPLSSFSSRIKMAYCLGLISKSVYHDLDLIRKIRNKFAHKMHGYSFDEPEIVNWCKSLKLAKMITDLDPTRPNSHGRMFILGVTQLCMQLGMKIVDTNQHHAKPPKDPEIGAYIRVESKENAA